MEQYYSNKIKSGYSNYLSIEKLTKVTHLSWLSKMVQERADYIENYNNWYLYNKELYYLKSIADIDVFINELLGEELSIYMGIPTINYKIISDNDKIVGLISKNFKDENKVYKRLFYTTKEEYEYVTRYINQMLLDYDNKSDDKRLYTLYLLRNYFTMLKDRAANDIYIDNLNGTISFAPLYDYESEFEDYDNLYYIDLMCSIYPKDHILFNNPENILTIEDLRENNIFTEEAIDKIKNVNLLQLLKKVEDKHNICIPYEFKEKYHNFSLKRKKLFKELGILK